MTDGPTDASSSGGKDFELNWPVLMELLNSVVSRTRIWYAAELLDGLDLTDEEVDALRHMPILYRQQVVAQLLDMAESIREGSRTLDAQLMRLTGEMV